MRAVRGLLVRLAAMVRGHGRADADLWAEMEVHLEMETEENIRRGMPPDEARRQAMIASGGLAQAAESVRDQRGLPWLESLAADVRYAARRFRRTPWLTLTVLLVLSLGIGTTIVLFTVLSSQATLPAPGIARDASLVRIRGTARFDGTPRVHARLLSWPEVRAYAGRRDLFSGVAAYAAEGAVVGTGGGGPPLVERVVYTTPEYFRLLRIHPVLGSVPAGDGEAGRMRGAPGVMISHAFWRRRFGGARDVIGRIVEVNGVPVQVVGVGPPRFAGTESASAAAVWAPLAGYPLLQRRTPGALQSGDSAFLGAVARLRPGVTPAGAAREVAAVAGRKIHADDGGSEGADVVPLLAGNGQVDDPRDALVTRVMAGGLALLVLLIACTNAGALLTGQAIGRRREIAVRLALGARRGRLIRQLLTESVLLALAAATVGLLATWAGVHLTRAALGGMHLAVDRRVALAALGVAVAAGLLLGLSPALHATRGSVGEVLKSGPPPGPGSGWRIQRALVAGQIALTQPLLVGMGLAVVTMVADAGGRAASPVAGQVVEVELDSWAGRVSPAERAARIAAAVQRVAAMPGVRIAVPMQMGTITAPLAVHPADRLPGVSHPVLQGRLTAAPRGYFEALEIPVVRGRGFTAAEHARTSDDPTRPFAADAVIIGSGLARRLWGAADPVGRRLVITPATPPMVVVGVVGEDGADDGVRVYVPYSPVYTGVIARTVGPALPLLDEIGKAVAAEAPAMPISRLETLAQRQARARRDLRHAAVAAVAGGVVAVLLSAVGLYAVVSCVTRQRTHEIGIRMALGARRGEVLRMFFASGFALGAAGLVLGLPLSIAVARLIATMLRSPAGTSPLLGVAIGVVVLLVASVGALVAAFRASAVDPVVALRTD